MYSLICPIYFDSNWLQNGTVPAFHESIVPNTVKDKIKDMEKGSVKSPYRMRLDPGKNGKTPWNCRSNDRLQDEALWYRNKGGD